MSFLVQRAVGRGFALNEVRTEELRIGRGTSAELRSDNPAVALEHAVIRQEPDGYTIVDRGSVTGTYVNGSAVETHRLAKGDVVEIGDLRIDVQMAQPVKPLFIRVSSTASRRGDAGAIETDEETSVDIEAGGTLRAPRIDFAESYRLARPYLSKLSFVAILLLITIGVIGAVSQPDEQTAFMPGGVSSAHAIARDDAGRPIAEKCNACHTPWNGVPDSRCKECHGQAKHAENVSDELSCTSCHMEHRSATKLSAIDDRGCIDCHQSLAPHMRVRKADVVARIGEVTSFANKHPEFTWPADVDTLRLNHKIHLKKGGIFDAQGKREELTCASCHQLVDTRGKFDPAPISFEKHCQRCHKLTFDPRFPTAEIPHGSEPGLVYGFIVTTYSGSSNLAGKSPEELRRLLGSGSAPVTPDERALLNAEQVIKTKCALCHTIERRGEQLAAVRPVIPAQWMPNGEFTHTDHRGVDCEKCHTGALKSTSTADVLMPAREQCVVCHGGSPAKAGSAAVAQSGCVLCHNYHLNKDLMKRKGALPGRR